MPESRIDYMNLTNALREAASRYVNGRYPYLPPLAWLLRDRGLLTGLLPEGEYDDPEAVARMWCTALGLGDGTDDKGTRTFTGRAPHLRVEVWYVTDRNVFES